jgi:hypothetical protein
MAEAISEAAEEQIRYIASLDAPGPFSEKAVGALRIALVEVDRLRTKLKSDASTALLRQRAAVLAVMEERDEARAQLAEIGKTSVEWGYWHEDEFNVSDRQFSPGDVRYYREQSGRPVERRLAGEWREVSDA